MNECVKIGGLPLRNLGTKTLFVPFSTPRTFKSFLQPFLLVFPHEQAQSLRIICNDYAVIMQ